jgi:3-isopropylmalate/(R)-2-methylmalate dehydratase small subunit
MATPVWMPNIDGTMSGGAWRFEGVLDVDRELCPIHATRAFGKEATRKYTYIELMESLKTVALQPLDPDFHKKVQRGDFLVGGDSTGYGHDHEYACIALRGAGIAAVLCEGTNVNFHRNSIHHGLPVVVIKGIMSAVKTGERLELNLVEGWLKNVTTGKTFTFKPWPDFILDIMREGGLYPWMREQSPSTGTQTSSLS